MKYNFKEILLTSFEQDFYNRIYWDNFCRLGVVAYQPALFAPQKLVLSLRLPNVKSFHDVSLAKSFYFLKTMFYGLPLEFYLVPLRKLRSAHPLHRSVGSNLLVGYFHTTLEKSVTIFYVVAFIILFLLPFFRSKQVVYSTKTLAERVVFEFKDLNNLVTGVGAIPLYYDYFDWEDAKLVFMFFFRVGLNENNLVFSALKLL